MLASRCASNQANTGKIRVNLPFKMNEIKQAVRSDTEDFSPILFIFLINEYKKMSVRI